MSIMGVTEVDAVSQRLVMENMVQQYLQQAAQFPSRVMTFMAAPGAKSVDIPKAGGFTVADKAENVGVTAQTITWAVDNLPLTKHRVIQVNMEKIASLQSKVAQELQVAERAGLDLAFDTDLKIVTEFYAGVSTTTPDHLVAYAGSGMASADVVNAKKLLDIQKVPQDGRFLAVDPTAYSQLLSVADFVRYDALNQSNIPTGVLGKIFGFEVFLSNAVTVGQNIAFHKSALAYGVQQGVTYDTDKDLPNLSTLHSFDQIYGVKALDAGKRAVVIGTGAIA